MNTTTEASGGALGHNLQLWLSLLPAGRREPGSWQSARGRELLAWALAGAGVVLPAALLRAPWSELSAALLPGGLYPAISHCRQLVVATLGRRPLGVDCESARRQRDWQALAAQAFSSAEAGALSGLRGEALAAAFLRHWTLKEAAIKALGGSVFGDLNRLRLEGGQVRVQDLPQNTPCWAWSGTCQGAALSLFGLGEAPALSAWWWDGSLALPAEALQGDYLPVCTGSGQAADVHASAG